MWYIVAVSASTGMFVIWWVSRGFSLQFSALSCTKLGWLAQIKNVSVTAPWCKIINVIVLMEPSVLVELL